jgi:hypothetical protein
VLKLNRLSIGDLVADLQALLILVVLIRLHLDNKTLLNILFNYPHLFLKIGQLLLNIQRFFIAHMVCNDLVNLILYLVSCLLEVPYMVIDLAVLLYLNPEKALLEKIRCIL